MKIVLTALLSIVTLCTIAQSSKVGHLSIFSEDGDRFTLYLNGEMINDEPQTNLRVEDLSQPYYNARIVFEDTAKTEIRKKHLLVTDADGYFVDVTYRVSRDKNNKTKMKLRYFSSSEVKPDFIPAQNVHVIHYGQPRNNRRDEGVRINSNLGGINVNVNVSDPNQQEEYYDDYHSNRKRQNDNYNNVNGCTNKYAMSAADFNNALSTLKNQKFDDTRLKVAQQIASANCLSVNQIKQIASLMSFEDSKLDFAKFAYNYCTDPKNYFNLNDVFSFDASVNELSEYIQNNNR